MGAGKGKSRVGGEVVHGVIHEETGSERSEDENQPPTATQSEFRPEQPALALDRMLSPSVSTWGYSGQMGKFQTPRSSPSRPRFGTASPIENPLYEYYPETDIRSPLPQQVTRPSILMNPPDTKASEKPSQVIAGKDSKETDKPQGPNMTLPNWTKGSQSKTMASGVTGRKDVRWIEQVPVKDLHTIQGPLIDLPQKSEYYSLVFVEFYATEALHRMINDPKIGLTLEERWNRAMKLGGAYMSKSYNIQKPHGQLTVSECGILKDILEALDELLKKVDKYSDGRLIGFKMNKSLFKAFAKQLVQLRNEMKEEFIIQGEPLPTLPQWGLEGNVNLFWSANDFEILGACFREDVTQFCVQIMEVYKASREVETEAATTILPKQSLMKATEGPAVGQKNSQNRIISEGVKAPMFDDAPVTHYNRIQSFTNRNASIFGAPSRHTTSQKLQEMLTAKPNFVGAAPDPNDPGGNDDGDDGGRPPRRNPRGPSGGPGRPNVPSGNGGNGGKPGQPSGPPSGDPSNDPSGNGGRGGGRPNIPQFDSKLKVDVIPTWDGNPDDLGRWLMKINRLSERSELIYKQLGYLVPTRLSGAAELWYYSQSAAVRSRSEEDWGTLRNTIAGYYMNRSYLEKQRVRANRARYRQAGYITESPSEYFIRKLELLEIVYNYSEGELINEIMAGAPSYWSTILAPHLYDTIESFQMAIKFQEENLLRVGLENSRPRQDGFTWNRESRNPFTKSYQPNNTQNAKVNAVGWSKATSNPPFPKDDSNVSPKATPEQKGGRPCRHCGSLKHWDPECKYSRKGQRNARVNAVAVTEEDEKALQEYEDLYLGLETDEEEIEDLDF